MAIVYSNEDSNDLTIRDLFDLKKELPEGVDFESLSDEEKKKFKNRYRFSGYKPGLYQGITGLGGWS
ncbi:MAG: hypothetical protein M0R32_09080 [Candidatus Cloacimonetes bacterium]|jgi:hypothetical protein|nr:hypothetical protein [Candidatus Cloacimonadota bacterium]